MELMKSIEDALMNNWQLIAMICLACASVVNALTLKYDKKSGAGKWLAFGSELLSFIPSKYEVNGKLGKLKLPLFICEIFSWIYNKLVK